MTSLMSMNIKHELRPCIADEEKALFHCWEQCSQIIEPSIMIGGHQGGVVASMFGIVEFENGEIHRIHPYSIRFLDNKFKDYSFEELGSLKGEENVNN